jgi:outer membrane lipoprotein carrier protein
MNSVAFAATEFMPKNFQLEFEQVFKSLLTGQEKKSKGLLLYLYPGQIKLEIGEKSDLTVLVANSEKMWFYRSPLPGDKGELVERMVAKTGLVRFFDVLKKGLIPNNLYSVEKVGENFLLKFATNISRETELKSAMLTFKKRINTFLNLDSIDLEYVSGKKIKMVVLSIKSDLTLTEKDFTFTPPENTKVIKE